MEFNTSLTSTVKNLSLVAIASVFLIGCSSTQNVYDDDGIYSSSQTDVSNVSEQEISSGANSQVYKNYFEKGAQELSELEEDGAVFTDIESYTSEAGSEIYVDGSSFETNTGYARWGDETQDVEVNIYNNNPFWGFNNFGGFGYGGFGFGGFYGHPWYGGFNSPFFGYGRFGYAGFGFGGFGFGGFGYGPFFNYGNNFNNHFYARNGGNFRGGRVAYNNGRRSSISNAGRRSSAANAISSSRSRLRAAAGRATRSTSRNTYSRSRGTGSRNIGVRPSSASRDGVTRGRPAVAGRPASGSRPNATRPSRPSRTSGNQARPSRPVRSSGTNSRPSSRTTRPAASSSRSSSRSSSYSRSSSRGGSSSRSSGGGRSGGRRG